MNNNLKKFLFWTPRILGILIVGFLTLLSTDVFMEAYGFWGAVLGFFMHMLPGIAVLIVLVLAWRWEWIGAIGFIAFGIWYVASAWDNPFHWSAYALLAGLPGFIGVLFGIGWLSKNQIQSE